uniref:Chitobiosyldiphosphodolichol beta-mannosyltransferase-like n=1 Tax=Phallusia mammillata TaxID=59560 RepID=A0A6F9D6F8_9ASCI|nr:chitobiosyldiphosphodolichol beta-mannosyltransferase-like [Phallusia mammillata]
MTWRIDASEFILVQNPPCIPTLAVCLIMSVFNGSKLVIDWHNYGYSILALSLNKNHLLVKIAKWYEEIFGQLSSGNLCVTNAMKNDLKKRWHICAEVMQDRPSARFKQLTNEEKHQLITKLMKTHTEFSAVSESDEQQTRFTVVNSDDSVSFKHDRPALIISSTSWTDDEDFSVLLNALQMYEDHVCSENADLPDILCAITGKGPNKSYYQKIIASKNWKHVQVITPWLEAEDYPKLLGTVFRILSNALLCKYPGLHFV